MKFHTNKKKKKKKKERKGQMHHTSSHPFIPVVEGGDEGKIQRAHELCLQLINNPPEDQR